MFRGTDSEFIGQHLWLREDRSCLFNDRSFSIIHEDLYNLSYVPVSVYLELALTLNTLEKVKDILSKKSFWCELD